jgi:hypothetical protein
MTATAPPHRHVLSRLQLEWDRLARRPAAVGRARRWPLVLPCLESLDDVLDHTGYGRRGGPPVVDEDDANHFLGQLVIVGRDDELAARVVLQRILPGLANRARHRGCTHLDRIDAFDELLSCAWTVIRAFPVERRPTHIASNLIRDAEYHAFVKATRRRGSDHPVPDHELDRPGIETVDPAVELAELLADARRAGVADDDLRLVAALAAGATTTDLAAHLQVTDRTVRNHRRRALHELRRIANAA